MKLKVKEKSINFSIPSYEEEEGEFNRYNFSPQEIETLRSQFTQNNIKTLTDSVWSKLGNTDSWEVKSLEDVKNYAEEYGKNWERIADAVKNNATLPAPIVLHKDGKYELIGGNTRLMVLKALKKVPKVLMLEL